MGKLEYFIIDLQKQNAIFTPGESVRGILKFKTTERFKINSISLLVEGAARVHWSETRSTGKSSHQVVYSENEQYLKAETLFLSKQAGNDLFIEVGEYSYPFEVILPANIPSSFEHHHGKIRYSVKGTIDIPWAIDKHTYKSFTVINNVDLNQFNPNVRQPMEVNGSKNVLLSFGGPITAFLSINKRGFVPGETIYCNASINNNCNRDVIRTRVKLVQEIKLVGSSRELIAKTYKTRKEHRDVAKLVIDKEISGKTSETVMINQPLLIPSVCATSNSLSKIIEISYLLIFSFGVRGSLDRDLVIPVVIGTVPLRIESEYNVHSYLPPTYEESMFGVEKSSGDESSKGDVYDSDVNSYRPLYPNFIGFEPI